MGIGAGPGVGAAGTPPQNDRANAVLAGSFTAVGPSQPLSFLGWANLAIWAAYNSALTTTAGSLAASVASAGLIAQGAAIKGANVPPGTTVGAISGTSITLSLAAQTFWANIDSSGLITNLVSTAGLLGATVSGPNIPANTVVSQIVTPAVPAVSGQNADPTLGSVRLSNPPTSVSIMKAPQAFTFQPTGNAVSTGVDTAASFTGAAIVYTGTVQLEKSFDGGNTYSVCNIGGAGTLAYWSAGTPVSTPFSEPEGNVLYRFNCTSYTTVAGISINYRMSEVGYGATALSAGPQM